MFCPKCGTKIEDDDLFCPSCGELVKAAPDPPIKNDPASEVNSEPKNPVKNAGTFVVRNRFRMAVIAITAFMAFAFVLLFVTELKATVSELSALERLPAASGTLLYMTCLMIPVFLAFQTIRVALIIPRKTTYEALDAKINVIDRSIYLPVIANTAILLSMLICSFIFTSDTMNEKFAPLIIVFSGYQTATIVCTFLCAVSLILITVSAKSEKSY